MTVETDALELVGLAVLYPEIAELLKAAVAVGQRLNANTGITGIVAAHQAPATIARKTFEDEEWGRQTGNLIDMGVHEALKLSEEAYRLTIPTFDPKLRSSDGVYGRFLVVEPRIVLPELHRLLGITEIIDSTRITNVGVRIPREKPYVVCLQNGPVELFVGTFDQAVVRIPRNGVAISFIEDDMTWLQFPELYRPWVDAGSSRYCADRVPFLFVLGDRPKVSAFWVGYPYGLWRLLSRGKKIGT